ncbi:MAG TPA: hypothetical protein PLP17_02825 [Oligoflexia bacterium]|nr:hypothetical protein [Oligoflexia bacterium]
MTTAIAENVKAKLNAMGVESIDDSAEEVLAQTQAAASEGSVALSAQTTGEAKSHAAAAPSREMTVSTFVHLLGLPTTSQLDVLESKIDSLTAKLNTVFARVERISAQLDGAKNDTMLDRLEFQLTDIRNLLKKGFASSAAPAAKTEAQDAPRKPIIMTSAPLPHKETARDDEIDDAQLSEEARALLKEQAKADADFQADEALRIRGTESE